MGTVSSIFALGTFLFSAVSYAAFDTTEIAGNGSSVRQHRLERPASVRVENRTGNVTLAEASGEDLEVLAFNHGREPVNLHLESESDRVRIWLEFPKTKPESLGGLFRAFVGRGSVVITSHAGDANVIIDGNQVISSGGSVDLTVNVPKHLLADLEADLAMGDVTLKGHFAESEGADRRRIDLKTSHGNVTCRETCGLGRLNVRSRLGDLTFDGVIGPLDAKTSHGNVTVVRGLGDMELKSSMGDVTVEQSVGDVFAKTSHGEVKIVGQRGGTVEGKSSLGDVYFDNPEAVSERGRSSLGDVRRTPGLRRKEHPGSPLQDKCVADLVREAKRL